MTISLPRSLILATAATTVVAAIGASHAEANHTPAPNCGNVAIPKSTGGKWLCTFEDNFTGKRLHPKKWLVQRTAADGFSTSKTSCFVDSPDNVSLSRGVLKLTARAEDRPFICKDPFGDFQTSYSTGMVSTWDRFSQAYGRFEVRAKMPITKVAGVHSAIWLWPKDNGKYGPWPGSGEIDIAEFYSAFPDRLIPFIHYNGEQLDPNRTNNDCLVADPTAFHTYTVEWTPAAITILYDGKTCLVNTWNPFWPLQRPQPFDQPFIVSLTQALGIGENGFNPATTPLPATMQVDYVRVWR